MRVSHAQSDGFLFVCFAGSVLLSLFKGLSRPRGGGGGKEGGT